MVKRGKANMGKWIDLKIPKTRIYEIEKGKLYTVSVRYKNIYGKWKYTPKEEIWGNITDVRKRINEIFISANEQKNKNDNITTVDDLVNYFIESRSELNLVEKDTIHWEKTKLIRFQKYIGNTKLENLNRPLIEKVLVELKKENCSDYFLFRALMKFKQVCEIAVNEEIINRNPCRGIKLRPHSKNEIKETKHKFTKEEIKRLETLIGAKEKTGVYVAMYIALTMGMRRGEIVGLLWKDIDFENKTIKINKQYTKNREMKTPKTQKSTRTIVMSQKTIYYLNDWKMKQLNWANKYGLNFDENTPVIANEKLTHISPDNMRRTWSKFFISNNFASYDKNRTPKYQGLHFHSLRDAHASLLFNTGAREKEVQERLGHSKIYTTMDIYTNIFQETKENSAKLVDKFFT